MILPITIYGNDVLRKKTKAIDKDYPDLSQLISDMKETMVNSNGIGLSAPQIGKSISLFIGIDMYDKERKIITYINPEIIEKSKECEITEEGCLSIPGIYKNVIRPNTIKVKYFDENFNKQEKKLTGINSILFQHEYDHLQGILFVDYVKKKKLKDSKGLLNNMENGNFEFDRYKIVSNEK